MGQVIFIRHGETEWNTEKRIQGHLNSPLTKKGEEQALMLATRLKKYAFTTLYSSDLGRAMQTAKYISDATGVKVQVDQELREHNIGIFQGQIRSELPLIYPSEWGEHNSEQGFDYVIPEGESPRQRYNRAVNVLNKLAERHSEETIVLVSHGEILRDLFEYILGLEPGGDVSFRRKNVAFNLFSKTGSKWMLEVWGDTEHYGI